MTATRFTASSRHGARSSRNTTHPEWPVAETWTPPTARNYLYARPTELGQVFDFALLKSPWERDRFAAVIDQTLAHYREAGGGLTWVPSSHDVPRHASRLALDVGVEPDAWLRSNGHTPRIDQHLGLRRAQAARLIMLALPGSAYLYQGEELGLPEVTNLSAESIHDPIYHRTNGLFRGRDGCRVPLPWTTAGPSFGFSSTSAWLSQPVDFGSRSVQAQTGTRGSTLELCRRGLALRTPTGRTNCGLST